MTETTITLSTYKLETFAYHVSVLFRESGKFGLSRPDGAHVSVVIEPSSMSVTDGNIWDSCTMDGHSVGNRCGAGKAYARFWAGESEWWAAR